MRKLLSILLLPSVISLLPACATQKIVPVAVVSNCPRIPEPPANLMTPPQALHEIETTQSRLKARLEASQTPSK